MESDWNAESMAILRLALVRGIGWINQRKLVERFGSARSLWAARSEWQERIDADLVQSLRAGTDERMLERVLRWRETNGHQVITWNGAMYPEALRHIPDPPLVLYARGRADRLHATSLAIVGSRNATSQGRRDAFELAAELSRAGVCIVSGMALGIDAAAHEGGLSARASSVAVLGTGIDIVYPSGNRKLAARLAEEGCVVCDFEPGTAPSRWNFPVRNRLISGLARGVLVIEAALKSGSLITAKCALDQGRDVFAMPGSIHSPLSKGAHELLRQGAKLTECADDVLFELGLREVRPEPQPAKPEPRDKVLDAMGFAPISLEQLAARSGFSVAEIAQKLTRLEIEGRVAVLTGGLFQRTARAAAPH